MIPARFTPYVFAFILSGCMSCLVSGVATAKALGLIDGFFGLWMAAWIASWAVAFPAAVFFAPIARKLAGLLCASPVDQA